MAQEITHSLESLKKAQLDCCIKAKGRAECTDHADLNGAELKIFNGSLHCDFCGQWEAEYRSNGFSNTSSRTREKALKKLIKRLRDDADFIEKYMINESTNQK